MGYDYDYACVYGYGVWRIQTRWVEATEYISSLSHTSTYQNKEEMLCTPPK